MGRKSRRPNLGGNIGLDFRKRNAGFEPAQNRLLRDGMRTIGPVRLLRREEYDANDGMLGLYNVWLVENLVSGAQHLVSTQSLGPILTDMEVLAWVSR
jgi:hypothetical protein